MNGLTFWMPSIASALALGLSALSLRLSLSARRDPIARAMVVGKAMGLKYIYDHCRESDRQALLAEARLRRVEARQPAPTALRLVRAEESSGVA